MSENEKKPLLHRKVVADETAEDAQKRCSDTGETDHPNVRLRDTPWGKIPTFIGDKTDIIYSHTMAGLARGFGFKKAPGEDVKTRYAAIVEAAITQAGETRERVTVEATDGAEAYAYPLQGGIAWGVNAAETGVNILRGVRRQDGTDEAVS